MKKSIVIYLIILLIGLPLLLYTFFFSKKISSQFSRLEDVGVVDTALVVRGFIGAKRTQYYEYVFKVEDNCYNGFLNYSPSYGPILVGDSCLVRYLLEDPDEINELMRDDDNQLMILE